MNPSEPKGSNPGPEQSEPTRGRAIPQGGLGTPEACRRRIQPIRASQPTRLSQFRQSRSHWLRNTPLNNAKTHIYRFISGRHLNDSECHRIPPLPRQSAPKLGCHVCTPPQSGRIFGTTASTIPLQFRLSTTIYHFLSVLMLRYTFARPPMLKLIIIFCGVPNRIGCVLCGFPIPTGI